MARAISERSSNAASLTAPTTVIMLLQIGLWQIPGTLHTQHGFSTLFSAVMGVINRCWSAGAGQTDRPGQSWQSRSRRSE